MKSYGKKIILFFSSICFLFSIVLVGCTKQKAEYEPDTKFSYNDIQESKKEIVQGNETMDQPLAVDSLGQDMEGNGIQEFDLEDGGVGIIQQADMTLPELPDMPLQDLENAVAMDNPLTEASVPEAQPSQTPDAKEQQENAPAMEAPAEQPQNATITADAETTTPEPATEAQVTDTPDDVPTTEASGEESGNGEGTQPTPPAENTDNSSGGDGGNPGEQGSNPEMPGDSTPSDAGTGESGTGEEGNGDSGGGDAGGNESGDNGVGNGDDGNGGSGDGGNGDGGNGGLGGDEPTEPGIGGNPDEVVRIWYEGTLGNYIWGETPDTSNLKVYAEFGDGTEKEVDAYNVNMNYPERYVADLTARFPKTYDPGVYNATISYQNAQIECPYNLMIHFVSVIVCTYGSCKNIEAHNAKPHDLIDGHPEAGQVYIGGPDDDCFNWVKNSQGKIHCVTANFDPVFVPVYYDYTYTVEDLKSDNYYFNLAYDLSDAENIYGGPITTYKNSMVSDGYYSYTYVHSMYVIYEDLDRVNELSEEYNY